MDSSVFWGGLAFLALAGWSWSVVAFARSSHSQANALLVLDKIDERMDGRISKVVERILARQQPKTAVVPGLAGALHGGSEDNAASAMLRDIFGGGSPLVPQDDEQPDASDGLSIVDA